MPLCSYCWGVTIGERTRIFKHHHTLEAFRKSANDGCRLCQMFWQRLCLEVPEATLIDIDCRDVTVAYIARDHFHTQGELASLSIWGCLNTDTRSRLNSLISDSHEDRTIVHAMNAEERDNFISGELRLFADEHDPAALVFPGRKIQRDPASKQSFSMIVEWLNRCTLKHDQCSSAINPLPSRLIDVGSDQYRQHPFLASTKNRQGRYVALSYCWGTSANFRTTQENLSKRSSKIRITETPPTIQDAIHITRILGLQYLWVDAVCIIQDSSRDWQREAAKMGQIYKNAFLTICAAGGSDVHSGILNERPESPYTSCKLPYHHGTMTENLTAIMPYRNENDPSSTRAWILQEKLLSTRVLTYTKHEVYMECNFCASYEDGQFLKYRRGWAPLLRLYERSVYDVKTGVLTDSWSELIILYTRRKLSVETDKLPAISGLAQEILRLARKKSTISNSQGDVTYVRWFKGLGDVLHQSRQHYLAGLWRQHLPLALCWSREGTYIGSSFLTKPGTYRAPSWSWASLDGPIEPENLLCDTIAVASILDARTTLVDPTAIYGQVNGGWITMKGPMKCVRWMRDAWDGILGQHYLVGIDTGDYQGICHFDHGLPESPYVWCLMIHRTQHKGMGGFGRGIVLIPANENSSEYRRIGMFEKKNMLDYDRDWLDDWERMTVDLI